MRIKRSRCLPENQKNPRYLLRKERRSKGGLHRCDVTAIARATAIADADRRHANKRQAQCQPLPLREYLPDWLPAAPAPNRDRQTPIVPVMGQGRYGTGNSDWRAADARRNPPSSSAIACAVGDTQQRTASACGVCTMKINMIAINPVVERALSR